MKINISDETVCFSENTSVQNIHSLLKFWGWTEKEGGHTRIERARGKKWQTKNRERERQICSNMIYTNSLTINDPELSNEFIKNKKKY